MTRDEWKTAYSEIRRDARAFREAHGGYPCFAKYFNANGREWELVRSRSDGTNWRTDLRPSVYRKRSWQSLHAVEMQDARRNIAEATRNGYRRHIALGSARLALAAAAIYRTERQQVTA